VVAVLFQVKIQLGEGSATAVTRKMLAEGGVGSFYKVCSVRCSAVQIVVVVGLYCSNVMNLRSYISCRSNLSWMGFLCFLYHLVQTSQFSSLKSTHDLIH
jgi:hypothetical protein